MDWSSIAIVVAVALEVWVVSVVVAVCVLCGTQLTDIVSKGRPKEDELRKWMGGRSGDT